MNITDGSGSTIIESMMEFGSLGLLTRSFTLSVLAQ